MQVAEWSVTGYVSLRFLPREVVVHLNTVSLRRLISHLTDLLYILFTWKLIKFIKHRSTLLS